MSYANVRVLVPTRAIGVRATSSAEREPWREQHHEVLSVRCVSSLDRCDGVDRPRSANAAKGSEGRGRSELAADSQQLGARRGDVDFGRQKRSHLGATCTSVDSRGAARQRRTAGTPARCGGETAGPLGGGGRGG